MSLAVSPAAATTPVASALVQAPATTTPERSAKTTKPLPPKAVRRLEKRAARLQKRLGKLSEKDTALDDRIANVQQRLAEVQKKLAAAIPNVAQHVEPQAPIATHVAPGNGGGESPTKPTPSAPVPHSPKPHSPKPHSPKPHSQPPGSPPGEPSSSQPPSQPTSQPPSQPQPGNKPTTQNVPAGTGYTTSTQSPQQRIEQLLQQVEDLKQQLSEFHREDEPATRKLVGRLSQLRRDTQRLAPILKALTGPGGLMVQRLVDNLTELAYDWIESRRERLDVIG